MNNIEELEKKPIGKLLVQYSVPAVLSLLANSLYTVVDRIFIGHIPDAGSLALTGIGPTMPIVTLILALAAILAAGTFITQVFPEFMVGFFTQDPVLVDLAVNGIGKYMVLLSLTAIPTFGSGFMMLTGKPKVGGFISVSRQSVILGLTIFLLPRAIGQNGLWYAQPITDLLASILTIILFIREYRHIVQKNPHSL